MSRRKDVERKEDVMTESKYCIHFFQNQNQICQLVIHSVSMFTELSMMLLMNYVPLKVYQKI